MMGDLFGDVDNAKKAQGYDMAILRSVIPALFEVG